MEERRKVGKRTTVIWAYVFMFTPGANSVSIQTFMSYFIKSNIARAIYSLLRRRRWVPGSMNSTVVLSLDQTYAVTTSFS